MRAVLFSRYGHLTFERRRVAGIHPDQLVKDRPCLSADLALTVRHDVVEDDVAPTVARLRQRHRVDLGTAWINPRSPDGLATRVQPDRRDAEAGEFRRPIARRRVQPDPTPRGASRRPVAHRRRRHAEIPMRLLAAGVELGRSPVAADRIRPVALELVRQAEVEPGRRVRVVVGDVALEDLDSFVEVASIERSLTTAERKLVPESIDEAHPPKIRPAG